LPDAGSRAALRRRLLRWRSRLPPAEVAERSERIAAALLAWPVFRRARCLLAYLATPHEVQTEGLIAAAHAEGRPVCAPAVADGAVRLRRLLPGARPVRGPLGVPEPPPDAPLQPESEVDLVLVPGVAFDPAGHRLGRGGGFYDRLLPRLPGAVSCGLAFREQVVAALDPAPWDVPVAFLCTEDGLRPCGPGAGAR
jgi:5-formyltetrahydrofolate cyclo-ligase